MLEEEYETARRVAPPGIRRSPEPERPFSYTLRPATQRDLPDIREIYNHYVANTVVTFDEEPSTLAYWREKFEYLEKLQFPVIVAVAESGQILGYALVSPWKEKAAYRHTVELSIYLGPAATGKGLGSVLLSALIDASRDRGIKEMIAVIADGGAEASIALHQRHGFEEVGRLGKVGFKFERWIGTVLMQKSLKAP